MCSVGAAGLTYFISAQSARVPKPFPLTYSLWGAGSLDGDMDGFGYDSFWVATSTAEASVGDEPGYGEPEFAYDKWTVVRINDRPLSTTFSDDTTVTIYDVNGWPVHVEYRRSGGSKPPLATRIEFHAPESWIRDALGEDWTDE